MGRLSGCHKGRTRLPTQKKKTAARAALCRIVPMRTSKKAGAARAKMTIDCLIVMARSKIASAACSTVRHRRCNGVRVRIDVMARLTSRR